jgi:hypothetical protein
MSANTLRRFFLGFFLVSLVVCSTIFLAGTPKKPEQLEEPHKQAFFS